VHGHGLGEPGSFNGAGGGVRLTCIIVFSLICTALDGAVWRIGYIASA